MISRIFARLFSLLVGKQPVPKPTLPPAEPPFQSRTERLLLRDIETTNAPAVHIYHSDPQVLRYQARSQPYSLSEVHTLIKHCQALMRRNSLGFRMLVVVLPNENRVIGNATLTFVYPISADTISEKIVIGETKMMPDGVIIGFCLNAEYWGKGYATEIADALLRYAFIDLGLTCGYAGCLAENTASRRVLEKVGMHFQGTQKKFPGGPPDSEAMVFSVDATAWRERHLINKLESQPG